jgi:lathosterol oxidase
MPETGPALLSVIGAPGTLWWPTLVLAAFQTISTAVNVYGHSGYELYPYGWSRHPLGRWINTSVAHNAHDATARCNDGLYFLWLDRWMGALDPGYDRGFDAATPRRAPRTP